MPYKSEGVTKTFNYVVTLLYHMSDRIFFTETDKKLNQMVKRKKLSDGRKKHLNTTFNEVYRLSGKTPSDLIEIGLKEQTPFIEDGVVKTIPLADRYITTLYYDYHDYLKKKTYNGKPNCDNTIRSKLVSYLSIFTEYDIEKPKPIKLDIPKKRIRDDDIPTYDDVFEAINLAKSPRDKAIISMASVTGFRVSDLVDFEIKDLIEACDIFFEEKEDKTLGNLLKKDPMDIVPCWERVAQKTSNEWILTITFNTPEASWYLFEYLKDRFKLEIENETIDDVDITEPLFKSLRKGKLQAKSVEASLNKLNKRMGNKRDKNGHYGKFRMHNLRSLFSTTCRRNIPNISVQSDDTYEGDIVSLFTGHITPNNPLAYAYDAVPTDNPDSYVRKTYQELIPFLSIRPMKVTDYKPQQVKEMEAKIEEMEKQQMAQAVESERKDKLIEDLQKQLNQNQRDIQRTKDRLSAIDSKRSSRRIKRIIRDFYYENYDDKLPRESVATWELAYQLAMENLSNFNDSDNYLRSLIDKARVKLKFNPDLINKIYNETSNEQLKANLESEFMFKTYRRICVHLGNIGLWDMVKDNEKEFKQAVADYLLLNDYIHESLSDEDISKISEDVMLDFVG